MRTPNVRKEDVVPEQNAAVSRLIEQHQKLIIDAALLSKLAQSELTPAVTTRMRAKLDDLRACLDTLAPSNHVT